MWVCLWIILLNPDFSTHLAGKHVLLSHHCTRCFAEHYSNLCLWYWGLIATHPLHDQSLEKVSVWKPVEKLVESRECWMTGRPVESRVCACAGVTGWRRWWGERETAELIAPPWGGILWNKWLHVTAEAFGEHPGLDTLVLVTCSQAEFTRSFVFLQPVSRHSCWAALK